MMKERGLNLRWLRTAARLGERIVLVRGNIFVHYDAVTLISTADVIIYNDIKFPENLNSKLTRLVFAKWKSGAALVVTKRLIVGKTRSNAGFLLQHRVTEEGKRSGRDAVGWTAAPIEYWIYRKQSTLSLSPIRTKKSTNILNLNVFSTPRT
jgi:hypothetical protein